MIRATGRWTRLLYGGAVVAALFVVVMVSVAAIESRAMPARVAFVNVQKVANESKAAQESAKRFQQAREEKTKAIAEKQKQVEALRLEIAQLGGLFQASRRAKARDDEQRARNELQALQNEAQTTLQKLQHEAQQELQQDLAAAVGELVQQRGADIVLNGDVSVVFARSGMDWTADVVERVNARHAKSK
jgi:Skp family chaperone for outer membrane proteins